MADVVKYGIQIPNRVFVGGVAFDTKEEELKEFFQQFGKIKECKIIKDNQNISRGFAFVTFECKHDAVQAQQRRTVYFNQKKLNLGPAIRQKGVVFNGAKEASNEPVLSTGVYIHPSGYSYTVAPNGVWYFHNPDGTPPAVTPGAPPMAYAPNTMHKIQAHSPPASTGKPDVLQFNEMNTMNDKQPIHSHQTPVYHEMTPEMQATQIIQADIPYPNGTYVHTQSAIGASNIHVAFQNMSISTHPATINHVPIPMHNNIVGPLPSDQLSEAVPSPTSIPNPRFTYNELYLPYYPNGKYIHQPAVVSTAHNPLGQRHVIHYPPRQDYYPVNSYCTFYGDSVPTGYSGYVYPNGSVHEINGNHHGLNGEMIHKHSIQQKNGFKNDTAKKKEYTKSSFVNNQLATHHVM